MNQDILEGSVERITYYSPEDGYSVIRLAPSTRLGFWAGGDNDGLVTVVGNLPDLQPGESVQLEGQWQTHTSYGRQFKAVNVHRVAPATIEGIRRYLGSGMIKGIGPGIAGRIVDRFGVDTIDILDTDPERLFEVEGVGKHRVHLITKGWQEQKQIKEVMLFLQSHGITTNLAVKIYKTYGDDSIKQVESDPYRLARDIHGVGFRTADKIAGDLGLAGNHPARLEAGVVYALNEALDEGHVYLPEDELIKAATELLEVAPEEVIPAIDRAAQTDQVKLDLLPPSLDTAAQSEKGEGARAVYLPPFYHSEVGAARRLRALAQSPATHLEDIEAAAVPRLIRAIAAESSIQLSPRQTEAVEAALTNKVSVLTGGPGTGKTTALRALIQALRQTGHSFALASPTGRAAKRLGEATGQSARTIHRMLGFNPSQGWAHNEDNPIPADFVIVDEASMLDEVLAYALFRAVDPRSHLLLVGDVDQLPSVGAGDVLRDLIASGVFAVTRLDVIFRQAEDSTIIANAHRVNKGINPVFPEGAKDFFLFNVGDDPERAAEIVIDLMVNRLPNRFGVNPLEDVQVIAPMYRGAVGVAALNHKLQTALNPPGRLAERLIAGRMMRVGDKVIQTVNNYDKEVFNGDVGRIRQFDMMNQTLAVMYDERIVTYDWSEATDLLHAYAISVHRSQGSEYPIVVMPIVAQHYMLLQRNLLYTAITRAKQIVVLVGSKKAISMAVRNDAVSRRYTALASRLREDW